MNKKFNIFFICLAGLFIISSVNAVNEIQTNESLDEMTYQITSDLTNDDIQKMFDSAREGDSFEFSDATYENISLVVDKKLKIFSKSNSKVYSSGHLSAKARQLGITDTFGFYFTSNSAGSVLSGITIVAKESDSAIIVDSSENVAVRGNVITGGKDAVSIRNAIGISITDNNISKAASNGIRLQNVSKSVVSNNVISYNKRSGIETSDMFHTNITNNTLHHNDFNGISIYNKSTGNIIKHNRAYENPNGIYIDSQSSYDVVNANSFTYNRRNTDYELGAFESGNGLLFGADFTTSKEGSPSRLEVKYNVLAHNEGYQAKNNPELPTFKLGDNWFDSTDDENTFVCPMLLAGIMRMGTITVKNSIGLQMYDTKGEPVKEFGTFDTKVNIRGNSYTANFVDGKAIIDANLEPGEEYDMDVMIGGQPVKFKFKTASGDEDDGKDSETSKLNDAQRGNNGVSSQTSANFNSDGISKGNSNNGNSSTAHYSKNKNSGVYGTNASGTYQDSSDNGNDVTTNGDMNSGDASEGDMSEEGKAYEVVPKSKISKEITDTSGLVVLSIVSVMGMLVYGYWRRTDFD